jgi:hypothetical protein
VCVVGGGAAWQMPHDVEESVKSFTPFWCVAVLTVWVAGS